MIRNPLIWGVLEVCQALRWKLQVGIGRVGTWTLNWVDMRSQMWWVAVMITGPHLGRGLGSFSPLLSLLSSSGALLPRQSPTHLDIYPLSHFLLRLFPSFLLAPPPVLDMDVRQFARHGLLLLSLLLPAPLSR